MAPGVHAAQAAMVALARESKRAAAGLVADLEWQGPGASDLAGCDCFNLRIALCWRHDNVLLQSLGSQELAQFNRFGLCLQHFADTQTQALSSPAQVNFQNLTDVHP